MEIRHWTGTDCDRYTWTYPGVSDGEEDEIAQAQGEPAKLLRKSGSRQPSKIPRKFWAQEMGRTMGKGKWSAWED